MLLRRYRVAVGLSQQGLAERARVSANAIGALERGDRRTPQRETFALLADALALSDEERGEFAAAAARSALPRRTGNGSVTTSPWRNVGISNAPLVFTSFVGRAAELAGIAKLAREHRLITLTGAGGVGKTRAALQVGTALCADAAVWFAALAPVRSAQAVVPTIASTLGVQGVPNRSLRETLLAYLENKTLLLILDNCEHVVTEAASIAESLLAGCSGMRILATSREPLRAAGEYTYRILSLSLPPPARRSLAATDAAEYDAVALFCARARGRPLLYAHRPECASHCRDLSTRGRYSACHRARGRAHERATAQRSRETAGNSLCSSRWRRAHRIATTADDASDDRLEL